MDLLMSWDILIMKFCRPYRSVAELPEDERPLDLGSCRFVRERVSTAFPGTDWADSAWGIWDASIGSIEFNLGNDNPVEGLMLHVRAHTEVVPLIVNLCHTNGWQGLDCSTGYFIE
jgi:hypothetical protein